MAPEKALGLTTDNEMGIQEQPEISDTLACKEISKANRAVSNVQNDKTIINITFTNRHNKIILGNQLMTKLWKLMVSE